jgi:protein-L-isoaspartate(D-aspartate) O-methyltransferase
MADTSAQRKNMVESQVRTGDVTDRRLIAAMLAIPREAFLPEVMRPLAYMDGEVLLAAAAPGSRPRALLAPRVFAKLAELANIGPRDVVLDVGAGCGYSAAVLGRLAETVVALESDAALAARAAETLSALSIDNVAIVQGPFNAGWTAAGPYAAIVVEGAIEVLPQALVDQVRDGGRLVAIIGEGGVSRAAVWQRHGGRVDRRTAFDAAASPLPGFERIAEFTL